MEEIPPINGEHRGGYGTKRRQPRRANQNAPHNVTGDDMEESPILATSSNDDPGMQRWQSTLTVGSSTAGISSASYESAADARKTINGSRDGDSTQGTGSSLGSRGKKKSNRNSRTQMNRQKSDGELRALSTSSISMNDRDSRKNWRDQYHKKKLKKGSQKLRRSSSKIKQTNESFTNRNSAEATNGRESAEAFDPFGKSLFKMRRTSSSRSVGEPFKEETMAGVTLERSNSGTSQSLKRNHMIDSIAWMSFHTARCVVEDITAHELCEQRKTKGDGHGGNPPNSIRSKKPSKTKLTAKANGSTTPEKIPEDNSESSLEIDFKESKLVRSRRKLIPDKTNPDDADPDMSKEKSDKVSELPKTSASKKNDAESNGKTVNFNARKRWQMISRDTGAFQQKKKLKNMVEKLMTERKQLTAKKNEAAKSTKNEGSGEQEASITRNDGCLPLPMSRKRDSALLFVDFSGFTKLSTMLDVESLSKVINSYFEKIINEVLTRGGDVLKFAGDAFFAEWQSTPALSTAGEVEEESNRHSFTNLSDSDSQPRTLADCVLSAALCGAAIVEKFSDYQVSRDIKVSNTEAADAVLNVHCGLGVGTLAGLHLGGHWHDEGDHVEYENRREYLILGEPIDQVSKAEAASTEGEIMASPEAIRLLAQTCSLPPEFLSAEGPSCIAVRSKSFVKTRSRGSRNGLGLSAGNIIRPANIPIFDSLRLHCEGIADEALARIRHQVSLYANHVARFSDMEKSKADNRQHLKSAHLSQMRHRAEAELRSVYTMFVKANLPSSVSEDDEEKNQDLYWLLHNIMQLACRELDRYSGNLRQFIVDDKGVVLIATFGLRGSTFPNLVADYALPATFAIHSGLIRELNVDNRIGATYGKVYCGIVGAIRRHEFAVMGAPVNLAARLMCNGQNTSILVDEAVQNQAGAKFAFKEMPAVVAKGYADPVPTLKPLHAVRNKKKLSVTFAGRQKETERIMAIAELGLGDPGETPPQLIFCHGESGVGKTALASYICDKMKQRCLSNEKSLVITRGSAFEHEQLMPLSAFRRIFCVAIREFCINEGSVAATVAAASPNDNDIGRRASMRRLRSRMPTASAKSFMTGPKTASHQFKSMRKPLGRIDSVATLTSGVNLQVPYFQKLCWACEKIGYEYEYADFVGARLLGLEEANKDVLSVDGKVPSMDVLAEIITEAFLKFVEFSDLTLVVMDDFHYIDTLSWKVLRLLVKRGKGILFLCLTRSHDKQALRRMSMAQKWDGKEHLTTTQIQLGPLALEEMRELIANTLSYDKTSIGDTLCQDIFNKSGGMPVFAIEVLETVKRSGMVAVDDKGIIGWKSAEEQEKLRAVASSESGAAVIEELFLHRFDCLGNLARQIVQACAVLGMDFTLSEVLQIHPDMETHELEEALDVAVSENILVENLQLDENEESHSELNAFLADFEENAMNENDESAVWSVFDDREFQFSHAMWRNSVLKTMLKERKSHLHRTIAESMEKDRFFIMESSDTSTLLTLFDHWKCCGEYCKAVPVALAVGYRLEQWESSMQSLDIYLDALNMFFEDETPPTHEAAMTDSEIAKLASATPAALDLILRVLVKIGKCYALLGNQTRHSDVFGDAYRVLVKTKWSRTMSRSLILPILSGRCVSLMQHPTPDEKALQSFVHRFVKEARKDGNPVHVCRALAMEASAHARRGKFDKALESHEALERIYKVHPHSAGILEEYGCDYAAQCYCDSVQWYVLKNNIEYSLEKIDFVIEKLIPKQDLSDVDTTMTLLFPVLMVMKVVGRANQALETLKAYVIDRYHLYGLSDSMWLPLYNPTAYMLEIARMDEKRDYDNQMLADIEGWVLEDSNSDFPREMEKNGYLINGEICWRLARRKREGTRKDELIARSKALFNKVLQNLDEKDLSNAFMIGSGQRMMQNLETMEAESAKMRDKRARQAQVQAQVPLQAQPQAPPPSQSSPPPRNLGGSGPSTSSSLILNTPEPGKGGCACAIQ